MINSRHGSFSEPMKAQYNTFTIAEIFEKEIVERKKKNSSLIVHFSKG